MQGFPVNEEMELTAALSIALSKSHTTHTSWLPYTQRTYDEEYDKHVSKTLSHDEMSVYIVSVLKTISDARKELVTTELS